MDHISKFERLTSLTARTRCSSKPICRGFVRV